MLPGEEGMVQAFHEFMNQVSANSIDDAATSQGLFSYILTNRQRGSIKTICAEQDWVNPEEKGVTLTREYFEHVLTQRVGKDAASPSDCATILASAYSVKSNVAINKPRYDGDTEREQQALIFNAEKSITVNGKKGLYGVAIIEISLKSLSPVTAYHARGSKVKAFG
ncbi:MULTISPECIES: hypothetical protein [Aeromonas]|nr:MULTISPECIES: hypothetical protein [Aeromonas]MCX4074643.1 hypothetical protein [Aeromonas caviae]MCX4106629.1 hypothetical protein [Aeromonas hydrophila]NJI10725.1 hypothetical protein [Aeromonas veronii]WMJ07204.1 hypothetical protein RBH93_21580 [Aeromonas veronii]